MRLPSASQAEVAVFLFAMARIWSGNRPGQPTATRNCFGAGEMTDNNASETPVRNGDAKSFEMRPRLTPMWPHPNWQFQFGPGGDYGRFVLWIGPPYLSVR